MSKLYKKENNRIINFSLIFSFIIIGMFSIFLMQKEKMILNLEKDYDEIIKEMKNIDNNQLAVLVDGEKVSDFPSRELNYKIDSINCTNNVKGYWDVENWQLKIADINATSTKCIISFISSETNDINATNLNKSELLKLKEQLSGVSLDAIKLDIINDVYPVGSIYMSTSDDTVEKVQEKFGGTWVSYAQGTTLISANDTYPVNTTGGSTTVNISHTHGTSTARNGSLAAAIGAVNSGPGKAAYVLGTVRNVTTPLYILTASSYNTSSAFSYWNHFTQVVGYTASGGSASLNIINPYTTVYMYKRTA